MNETFVEEGARETPAIIGFYGAQVLCVDPGLGSNGS
jgi:hypothetical protein